MQINQEIGLDSPLISPSYKHFAMLPDRAFQPRNGRSGMTLEGGGGGGGGSPEPIQETPPAPSAMKSNNLESIRSYIDNLQAQPGGASDAQVMAELDRFGITPAQFAQAYNVPVEGIQARYEAVRPPKSTSELGDKIFTGYQQLFGRSPDKAGYDYWMESFGGRDLDQAGINKSLLAGAQGSDIVPSLDYGLSLTGGRPDSVENRVARGQTGQFYQPIYNPSSKDYMPAQQAPAQTLFSQGFNPLDYTAGPQVQSSGTYNPFSEGVNPYDARMQSLPSAPVDQQSNPFIASYLAAYGQDGGVGQGESGQGGGGQGGAVG